ncbi:hypothetical protein COU17_02850 [Candidatus Kaiserbacteria bacterium CG10_big_fil_rev_8_21_14_0_10_49_17]|uniref:DNA alkylation repair protein n=1 Tax=Candidatus Kaiserbacteria bacterium CG10_big_fil_rev_8_21_14_0_10_49_17 TaxID=1974609 RepID=A0A2M6WDX1_9BACT|nr:MAG: hypothetical protein COU17_02850 [Candidatus Kaiserbacteria bacterium CG10_big_fil_rev_8_21_14_0_10_49_17]
MNIAHKQMLVELKKRQRTGNAYFSNDSYLSSGHHYYDVSVPDRRAIAKAWLKENQDISNKEFFAVLDSLYKGKSHEEKTLASILLGYNKRAREAVSTNQLDKWLNELVGWAEVDALCQSVFTAEELLADWKEWERFLRTLAKSKNVNKRRASLVFLTGAVRQSGDARLQKLAFQNIDTLKYEKGILVTKAISWLLREMIGRYERAVRKYLKENGETLPKVAVRETQRKLETGKK